MEYAVDVEPDDPVRQIERDAEMKNVNYERFYGCMESGDHVTCCRHASSLVVKIMHPRCVYVLLS